jgi:DNA-directed RNA polymerase specialized sigma24 family protein
MNQKQLIEICWTNEEIRSYCRSLTGSKGRFGDWEELLHELIIQLYKMDENKLFMASRCNYLEYLCFTIIKRIWAGNISETGIFKNRKDGFELKGDFGEVIEESHHFLIDELREEISKLHWYNETLLKMYLEGFNLREISEKTGINLKSVHYALKRTRLIIKNNLEKKYGTNLSNLK